MDLEGFEAHLRSRDRAERTIVEYTREVEIFCDWYLVQNDKPAMTETVTPLDVREWRRDMDTNHLAPATINRRLCALRAYFKWTQSTGRIRTDPTAEVRSKRQNPSGPKWLDRNELFRLRNAAQALLQVAESRGNNTTALEARRNKVILALLSGGGLRLSELVALKVDDVVIRERSGHVVVRAGKGDKRRTVPLNSDVRNALGEWLDARPISDRDELFSGRRGVPLQPRGVERIITKLCTYAGLDPDDVSPHRLRHSFGKALLNAGESLEKVQALMGHESIVTTTRYTTPSDRDLAASVEAISWHED
ncbi:MAG: tyrosine-type recombinase/integrase [Candidatus Poribacteria bacterium]|nr:tyrosine-type recombinase/integrase [Candidatus Poribacteria bacterium]